MMVTHPVVRYYNARMQPVAEPYDDDAIGGAGRFTFFCQRCDLPFRTPVIRSFCDPCYTAQKSFNNHHAQLGIVR